MNQVIYENNIVSVHPRVMLQLELINWQEVSKSTFWEIVELNLSECIKELVDVELKGEEMKHKHAITLLGFTC